MSPARRALSLARSLNTGEVHLWFGSLEALVPHERALNNLLSLEEKARLDKYAFPVHRRRFILRRGILRLILASYLECRAQDITYVYGAYGKPSLAGGPAFNLADCDDDFICAVTRHGEVGVDIERVRPLEDFAEIAQRYFSSLENKVFASLHESERLEAFFCGWTRKEAIVKAEGMGLSRPLDSFDVMLYPDCRKQTVMVSPGRTWSLCDIRPAPGLIGAVATAADQGGATTMRLISGFDMLID